MAAIHKIELERLNNTGTHVRKDDVDLPERGGDTSAADDESQTQQERQARESEIAFDQAITRLPPG